MPGSGIRHADAGRRPPSGRSTRLPRLRPWEGRIYNPLESWALPAHDFLRRSARLVKAVTAKSMEDEVSKVNEELSCDLRWVCRRASRQPVPTPEDDMRKVLVGEEDDDRGRGRVLRLVAKVHPSEHNMSNVVPRLRRRRRDGMARVATEAGQHDTAKDVVLGCPGFLIHQDPIIAEKELLAGASYPVGTPVPSGPEARHRPAASVTGPDRRTSAVGPEGTPRTGAAEAVRPSRTSVRCRAPRSP